MRNNQLYTIILFLLILCMTLSAFAGCGETVQPEKPSETDSQTEKVQTEQTQTDTETEIDPENDLIALLKECTSYVIPDIVGDYFKTQARAFADLVREKLGVTIEESDFKTRVKGTIFFGYQNPADLTDPDLGPFDYEITVRKGVLYVTLGSEYAAEKVVETIGTVLEKEHVSMPYENKQSAGSSRVLKVGSYNIKNGQDVGHNFATLAQDILTAGLDVVGLQEVDLNTSRNKNQDTMKALSEATGYKYYYYTKCIDLQGGEYGTAILSKYPILTEESVLLPSTGEQRAYGHVSIDVDGQTVHLFNTHLQWPSQADRLKQIPVLADAALDCMNVIVTGDMNSPGHAEYGPYFEDCNFANGDIGDDNYFITNAEDGGIDNIISTPEFTQLDSGIWNTGHSDHAMIWALLLLE